MLNSTTISLVDVPFVIFANSASRASSRTAARMRAAASAAAMLRRMSKGSMVTPLGVRARSSSSAVITPSLDSKSTCAPGRIASTKSLLCAKLAQI